MLQTLKYNIMYIEHNEVENRLEKLDFAHLVKDANTVAGFSRSRQFRVGPNDVTQTRPGCQGSFKTSGSRTLQRLKLW